MTETVELNVLAKTLQLGSYHFHTFHTYTVVVLYGCPELGSYHNWHKKLILLGRLFHNMANL